MTEAAPTKNHATGSPPIAGDASSFPSHAELVRTLLGRGGFASLTTVTATGHPYGSLAAYSVLDDGSPLVCISEMAEHTRNARRSPRAGLFVHAEPNGSTDPLDHPRASLIGDLVAHEPTAAEIDGHLAIHPQTRAYVEYPDFAWWRLVVASVRYIGGFGSMSWISGTELTAASADPVLPHGRQAVEHMNADHAESNLAMVRNLAALDTAHSATMTSVDRYGVTFEAATPDGSRTARLSFVDGPISGPDEIRGAVIALARRAGASGASA